MANQRDKGRAGRSDERSRKLIALFFEIGEAQLDEFLIGESKFKNLQEFWSESFFAELQGSGSIVGKTTKVFELGVGEFAGHLLQISLCSLELEFWRREPELNRRIKVLQTSALPLGYRASL